MGCEYVGGWSRCASVSLNSVLRRGVVRFVLEFMYVDCSGTGGNLNSSGKDGFDMELRRGESPRRIQAG